MPTPTVTPAQFGRAVPNDWPLRVPAQWMIEGKARDFWYGSRHDTGHGPCYRTAAKATRVIRALHREFGAGVTLGQCRYATRSQRAASARRAAEFRRAVALDVAAGRARLVAGRLTIAGLGTATLADPTA